MAKLNPLARIDLFNLKSFNSLKKDQTNIKIFKNSSFDSNFNSCSFGSIEASDPSLLTKTVLGPAHHSVASEPAEGVSPLERRSSSTKFIKRAPRQGDSLSYLLPRASESSEGLPKGRSCGSFSLGGEQPKGQIAIRGVQRRATKGEGSYPKLSAILRAIRSIRLNRDEWKLIKYINLMDKKLRILSPSSLSAMQSDLPKGSPLLREEAEKKINIKQRSYNKIFSNNNIISKNILLRNMKYNFLKSTLSSILTKKIRRISEVLEDKPIKNYVLYSYLKNCIFTPPRANSTNTTAGSCSKGVMGRSKLSLNKYKGRKFGSFINYNKIIGFNFNSIFYQVLPNCLAPFALSYGSSPLESPSDPSRASDPAPRVSDPKEGIAKARSWSCNRYIKDTYKLLFYLFKSMYCLISKPVLKYTNDKVTIQLFYYLNIPKKKIFRLFSISYIKSIKKKWFAQSTTAHSSPKRFGSKIGRGNTKLNIRWKIRKAISRLKNKIISSSSRLRPKGEGSAGSLSKGHEERGLNLLFLLRKFNLTKVYQKKFKLICAILSKKFNKPVELQLIRLHHPYHDSNILVNLLSLNIKNKRKKARVAIQKIYNKKPVKNLNDPNLKNSRGELIPAFLSGLNIKIAGRLMGEPIIPRITTKVYGKGASATGKVNYLDMARITKKNRKGAYTIKITSGQNFF